MYKLPLRPAQDMLFDSHFRQWPLTRTIDTEELRKVHGKLWDVYDHYIDLFVIKHFCTLLRYTSISFNLARLISKTLREIGAYLVTMRDSCPTGVMYGAYQAPAVNLLTEHFFPKDKTALVMVRDYVPVSVSDHSISMVVICAVVYPWDNLTERRFTALRNGTIAEITTKEMWYDWKRRNPDVYRLYVFLEVSEDGSRVIREANSKEVEIAGHPWDLPGRFDTYSMDMPSESRSSVHLPGEIWRRTNRGVRARIDNTALSLITLFTYMSEPVLVDQAGILFRTPCNNRVGLLHVDPHWPSELFELGKSFNIRGGGRMPSFMFDMSGKLDLVRLTALFFGEMHQEDAMALVESAGIERECDLWYVLRDLISFKYIYTGIII